MLYVFYSESFENSAENRQVARSAHLARLEELKVQGRLIVAGPCPAIDSEDPGPAGFTGSVIIAEFENLEAAQAWADSDPYATGGVYKNTTVKPYIKVLP